MQVSEIRERMKVIGSDKQPVGTVDKVEGETIKLTKTDSADHQHHTLPFDMVDRVEDNRIYLKVTKAEAQAAKA